MPVQEMMIDRIYEKLRSRYHLYLRLNPDTARMIPTEGTIVVNMPVHLYEPLVFFNALGWCDKNLNDDFAWTLTWDLDENGKDRKIGQLMFRDPINATRFCMRWG